MSFLIRPGYRSYEEKKAAIKYDNLSRLLIDCIVNINKINEEARLNQSDIYLRYIKYSNQQAMLIATYPRILDWIH
jgi:hypothetical protein